MAVELNPLCFNMYIKVSNTEIMRFSCINIETTWDNSSDITITPFSLTSNRQPRRASDKLDELPLFLPVIHTEDLKEKAYGT